MANESTKCSACSKTSDTLKKCAKCKVTAYCDRDCQKAHWKAHKTDCKISVAMQDPSTLFPDGEVPKRSDIKPFTAIYFNNFLHDRSEEQTFKMLIDTLRMRQEDVRTFKGENMEGTIYNEESSSKKAFQEFLAKAKQIEGFLPPWWTDEKAEECIRFGMSDKNFNLKHAQEKADIQKTWYDERMPMKLRMLGGKVYGHVPWGNMGEEMLAGGVVEEAGLHRTVNIDWARMFRPR